MPSPADIPDTDLTGPLGRAELLVLPDAPLAAETVRSYLCTLPSWHPLWSQYLVACVRLTDNPDFPPPKRQFSGATHEFLCVTINPEDGIWNGPNWIKRFAPRGDGKFLTPVNVAEQIEGTDAEADELAKLVAWSLVHGLLEPESSNGPQRIRAEWKTALVKTLAHIRGEEHAP
jgi:hypothetical protein